MNTDKLLRMLLEAIDYSFLQIDGSYDKTLTYPVIDKIQYIKEQVKNIEVKKVDLDYITDELDKVVKIHKPDGDFGWGTLYNVATHFFELGMSVSNKAQKGE